MDWDSGEVQDGRRQRYSDTEEALAWVNLSQSVIDEEWSELPAQWVQNKFRAEESKSGGRGGKECLVAPLRRSTGFYQYIVSPQNNPARDGGRCKLLLNIADKIHKLLKWPEIRKLCQEVV